MSKVAVAIMCKTPMAGLSKTRLSPPLQPDECAALSACFIRDLSNTIDSLSVSDDIVPYAVYTPVGSEHALRALLPERFRLARQCDGDFGARLFQGMVDLLGAGHGGAILVNSDSPTLPPQILQAAAHAVRRGDNVTLSPAIDGGYTLIGLSNVHARLFEDIPWSTAKVFDLTRQRAREIGLPVETVHGWYDVDDAESLGMLKDELAGTTPDFVADGLKGAVASATRRFLLDRQPGPKASQQ